MAIRSGMWRIAIVLWLLSLGGWIALAAPNPFARIHPDRIAKPEPLTHLCQEGTDCQPPFSLLCRIQSQYWEYSIRGSTARAVSLPRGAEGNVRVLVSGSGWEGVFGDYEGNWRGSSQRLEELEESFPTEFTASFRTIERCETVLAEAFDAILAGWESETYHAYQSKKFWRSLAKLTLQLVVASAIFWVMCLCVDWVAKGFRK